MSRQDKATTERNARILRDLVKQPDNKSCADCRKNDARWASWNLGCYLCIRCSGIHRSMGTHISKVKSIDLDIWTPEQMENIQKWGNRRANLYWEKHLKAGHVPPDHKIESFIRSKYESRRWAMEGPQPRDPSVLEEGGGGPGAGTQPSAEAPRPTPTSSAPPPAPAAAPKTHPLLSRTAKPAPSPAPAAPAPIVDLFGSDEPPSLAPPVTTTAPPSYAQSTPAAAPAPTTAANAPAPTAASAQPSGSIFDLDFRTPTPSSANSSKPQTAKADIMSLFSSATPTTSAPAANAGSGGFFASSPTIQQPNPYASWGGGVTSSAPPQTQHQATQAPVPVPSSGGAAGGWGGISMDQNAWGAPAQPAQPAQQQQSAYGSNPWGSTHVSSPPVQNQSHDPWAASGGSGGGFFGASHSGPAAAQPAQKKDDRDPFGNIWG
ncbi:hypothetical protein IAU60_004412 [Kwoniella sp. DSM 27419]